MIVDPVDRAILYSPGNWVIAPSRARTINAGAYLRLIFSGCTCRLLLDMAGNTGPATQFYALLNGAATLYAVAPSVDLTPRPLASGAHHLELIVKAAIETLGRWSPQQTVFARSALALAAGAVVSTPARRAHVILAFGDSITEGVRVHGTAAPADVDRNDAMLCWSGLIGPALDAEVDVIGFGGAGISAARSGGVPSLPSSWPDTRARSPQTRPTWRYMRTAVAEVASAHVVWHDTSADTCDGVHPHARAHRTRIAPKIIALVRRLLPAQWGPFNR